MTLRTAFVFAVALVFSTSGALALTPLQKMNLVFVGQPSEPEIEALFSVVAANEGRTLDEPTLLHWGSVLVALRKGSLGKVTEMEVLTCVAALQAAATFEDKAAICAAGIEVRR